MNRRTLMQLPGAAALLTADPVAAQPAAAGLPPLTIGMLVHPGMILLDLVGPQTALALTMGRVHLLWKTLEPVPTDVGIAVVPTTRFADCPERLDVICVPGGLGGTTAMMEDEETISFLRRAGSGARFVASVCTGSLLLGAAGLLRGRRATSHWYTRDILPAFGATPTEARVVEDGPVITAAGVTAGMELGLVLTARLRGEEWAKRTQLLLEYDPQPPFTGGSPAKAGPDLTRDVLERRGPVLAAARAAAERVARKGFLP